MPITAMSPESTKQKAIHVIACLIPETGWSVPCGRTVHCGPWKWERELPNTEGQWGRWGGGLRGLSWVTQDYWGWDKGRVSQTEEVPCGKMGSESVLGDDTVWSGRWWEASLHFSAFLWDLHCKSIWKVGNHEGRWITPEIRFLLLSFFISILWVF